jgi:hypothetical protein
MNAERWRRDSTIRRGEGAQITHGARNNRRTIPDCDSAIASLRASSSSIATLTFRGSACQAPVAILIDAKLNAPPKSAGRLQLWQPDQAPLTATVTNELAIANAESSGTAAGNCESDLLVIADTLSGTSIENIKSRVPRTGAKTLSQHRLRHKVFRLQVCSRSAISASSRRLK